ncbi:sensor histidine kinase [Luteococcus sp. Sow4_B9]|uniref:sensor histidine kinase n=1 Tax=Luteococcus sp. Sow4_B9 TaxID=3438792 RepID=UPI003F97AEC3
MSSPVVAVAARYETERRPRWRRIASQAWRVLLCYAIGLSLWLAVWYEALDLPVPHVAHAYMGVDLLVTLVLTPAIVWRHSHPRVVTGLLLLACFVSAGILPAALAALLALAARRRWPEVLVVGTVWMIGGVVNDLVVSGHATADGSLLRGGAGGVAFLLVLQLLVFGIVMAIGWNRGARAELVRSWRTAAELAQLEQGARVAQAQIAERARIAREMHDVLAHKISLISLHAGVLAFKDDLTPQESRETANLIRETSHQALEELREVLGVLRAEETDPVAPPQPSLLDLPALVAQEESAGARVQLRVPDEFWPRSAELSPSTARHAHRIIQESLTNARKHAQSLPVLVEVDGDAERGLEICVRNPLGNEPTGVPGAGLGLAGLRERAELAGGTLVGARTGTEFVVRARLPWNVRIGS